MRERLKWVGLVVVGMVLMYGGMRGYESYTHFEWVHVNTIAPDGSRHVAAVMGWRKGN